MRVLLDQGVPVPIRRYLVHHTVRSTHQQHWSTLDNGDLLTAAEANAFDIFVTTDKNLRYQQNLSNRKIGVVVLMNAQWPVLEAFVDLVVAAIDGCKPGGYTEVEIPSKPGDHGHGP